MKKKLTAAQRRERKRRKKEFMTIFINGKQKRVRRPQTIDGLEPDEFLRRNADPITLHQMGRWELMKDVPGDSDRHPHDPISKAATVAENLEDHIPF